MELGPVALPLAFLAGVAGILSPCVWPLIPVVVGSAASGGRWAPLALAAGLSLSFATAGSILSFVLVSSGIDPEFFRYIAAGILIAVGVLLVFPALSYRLTGRLSALTGRVNTGDASRWYGHFGVGFLLGIVWLPCVGPTLGAAIGLASMGQPWYNLYDRVAFEGPLEALCRREGLGVIPYFGLAAGFLTGKYRSERDLESRPRGGLVKRMMNERGLRILGALDEVAAEHDATPAQVALAWLRAHGVTAPIASATSLGQLAEIARSATLELAPEAVAKLDAASAGGEPPPSW